MNWLGLVFISAVILAVAYLMWHNKNKDRGGRELIFHEFTKIGYNINQMNPVEVERLGNRLKKVYRQAWPSLIRIYGKPANFFLRHIIFNTEFEEKRDEGGRTVFRRVIRLTMPGHIITMRPQGGGGHLPEYWFVLELHNLYRGIVFGIDNIYPKDNASDAEMKLWHDAQHACKVIVS